jgi:hypothetical protein
MDMRVYYQKIREQRASIADPFPVIVSHETADGGKAGIMTEVMPELAAKMTVDGTARLATAAEAMEFRRMAADAKKAADDAIAASKVQLTVVPREVLEQLQRKA